MASGSGNTGDDTPLSAVLSDMMNPPAQLIPLGDLPSGAPRRQHSSTDASGAPRGPSGPPPPPRTAAEFTLGQASAARPETDTRPARAGQEHQSPLLRGAAPILRQGAAPAGPSSILGDGDNQPRTPSRVHPPTATAPVYHMTPRAALTAPITWESLGRTRSPNEQLQGVVALARGDPAPAPNCETYPRTYGYCHDPAPSDPHALGHSTISLFSLAVPCTALSAYIVGTCFIHARSRISCSAW